jgi:hypothetical protein
MSPDRYVSGATRIEADPVINRGENLMRRASTCLAILGLAVLALSSSASAAPTVTFKAKAVPIPKAGGGTWPKTGNIYGAGAAFQSEFSITGNEYGGYPPPLIGVNVTLPKGTKLHTAGFKTCPETIVKDQKEPSKCPKGSSAGPNGHAKGFVVFGTERVAEEVTIQSFFSPNGLEFYVSGHSPTVIEIVSTGHYTNLGSGGGTGPKFIGTVPLIETVPGAADGSTETINVVVGAAVKQGGKTVYYGTVPKKGQCPKGGFPLTAELMFAGLGGLSPQTVVASYKAPCPRK